MYDLKRIETNEIAGEMVMGLVTISTHRTLTKAREVAFKLWKGYPPRGAKIVHCDGTEYDVPGLH